MSLNETLGTWTNGRIEMTATYQEEGFVRIDTVDGSTTLTNAEWAKRVEALQAGGCWKK